MLRAFNKSKITKLTYLTLKMSLPQVMRAISQIDCVNIDFAYNNRPRKT